MKQENFTQQIIDGLMLGDGNIYLPKNGVNAKYQQGSSFREFVVHVKEQLTNLGFIFDVGIREQIQESRNNAIGYHIRSRVHEYMTEQYYRWYDNHFKIVPHDIVLSPLVCNYWYLGDGGLCYCKNKFKGLHLSTQGFIRTDIDYLSEKLSHLGFRNFVETKGVIGLSPIPARKFLEYIGQCPVQCYQYKWYTKSRNEYNIVKKLAEMDNQQRSLRNEERSTTIP